jgi:hypothetical protein
MLGSAKKSIIVAITKNDEAIAIERIFSITLKHFCIVEAICQLTLVENLLKTTIRLRNQSSTIGLLKDSNGFVCEMNDIAHVQVQNEMFL